MTTEEILEEELELLKKELIEAHDEKGMRASGNWADSLEVSVIPNSGKIIGEKYTEQLEYGRRAGGFPPIDQIEQWVVDKGIKAIDENITNRTLAFLIARKIAREGWDRKEYGGVELVTDVITPQRIQKILNRIVEGSIFNVASDITRLITNLQNVA